MSNYVLGYNNYMIKEAKEDDEVVVVYSDDLLMLLSKIITDPVAKKILSGYIHSDVSYLDIDENSKNVSYLPVNRIKKAGNDYWKSSLRQSMTWGKMINKLYPDVFTNMDIDRFYNRYIPQVEEPKNRMKKFELVQGEAIKYWYHYKNWDGSLGSCMAHSECQDYFDIYTENPEKISLLILFSDKEDKPNKIVGRALIWKGLLKPSGDTAGHSYWLMDRVHFVDGMEKQIEPLFHKYAIEHGWIYKSGESFLLNGERKTTSVSIRVKPVGWDLYPYMDTMMYYTPITGRLASTQGNPGRDPNNPKAPPFPRYILQSQTGGSESLH